MRIEVNVRKKYFFSILAVLIVFIGVYGVYASWDMSKTLWHSGEDVKINIAGIDYSLQGAIGAGLLGNSSGVVLGKLECTTVSSGFRTYSASASCSAGYNLTGGACDIQAPDSGNLVSLDGIPSGNTYNCDLHAQNSNVTAYAFCCKVVSGSSIQSSPPQIGTCKTICLNAYTGTCDSNLNPTNGVTGFYDCNAVFPGYVQVGTEQGWNGASFFISRVKCCSLI
jgi:hypothetical protein